MIAHLYEEKGIGFLDDLIGMYAITIYDKDKKKFYLIRDRFGIKPLFYHANENEFIFSSEIKSLLRHPNCPREFNWSAATSDAWLSGAGATNMSSPNTFFHGINHVKAGTFLELDIHNHEFSVTEYWSLEEILNSNNQDQSLDDENYWIEGYYSLLEESVLNCLQSDVELGLFLSGGIDSAAIASLASTKERFHTFSVLSGSTFSNEDAKYAHLISKELNIPNHQVLFNTEDSDLLNPSTYKNLLWTCETPFCGPEQYYKYNLHKYAKSVRPNLKVMLTGQGSDEFNGGYSTTLAPDYHSNWQGFLSTLESMERNRLYRQNGEPMKVWEENFGITPFKHSFIKEFSKDPNQQDYWNSYILTKYRDLQMYNCWHEDRIAAANNIENRVPFLDHRLVEWVSKIPMSMRESLLWDKKILRDGMKSRLKPEYTNRPKVPFFYGRNLNSTHNMMKNLLTMNENQLIEEALLNSEVSNVFNINNVFEIIENTFSNQDLPNFEFLLRIINMGLLSTMATENENLYKRERIILPNLSISDWQSEEDDIRQKLGFLSYYDLDVKLELEANISLLKDKNYASDKTFIAIDGTIEYIVEREDVGPWIDVLDKVDGMKTLEQLLESENLILSDIKEFLDEAIEHGVIIVNNKKRIEV